MRIRVDLAKLKRQRSRFGDGVLVLLADCADPRASELIGEEADFGFAGGEFDGLSPMKAGVAPSPAGPVFMLEPAPPQLWAWLEELARRLDARGLTGTLTAATPAEDEDWFVTRPPDAWIGGAAFYPGWRFHELPRWAWDDQTAHEVPLQAAQWCIDGAERAFLYSGILTQVQPSDLPDVLTMATKRTGTTTVYAGGPNPKRVRTIALTVRGFAGCLINDDHSMIEQVRAVSAAFDWHPELMSHAFLRRFHSTPDPAHLGTDFGPFPLSPTIWSRPHNSHLIDRLVLDAHAIQILTSRHLERAHNLDNWTITDIAPNRYLVSAPNLDDWLTNATPDPETLAQASHDFGAMIATPEILEELKRE